MSEPIEQLVAQVHELNRIVRTLDADEATCRRAAATVEVLNAELAPLCHVGDLAQASLREDGSPPRLADDMAETFPYSPVVGRRNPVSPRARIVARDGYVDGEVTFTAAYVGPPNHVHGGIVAMVLDELLGNACVAAELGAFTGTLSVRYERPTPIGRPLALRARIDRAEGRTIFAVGDIRDGDVVCARAEGVFVRAPDNTPFFEAGRQTQRT